MKNSRLIILIILISILSFCTNRQTYQIEFKNANGLKENAKVLFKGETIGKVDKIGLNQNRLVIADIWIDRNFNMPDNYKFVMISLDLFGTKAIELKETDNNEFNNNKIIKGEIYNSNILDSLSNQAINILKEAATDQTNKQDSILIELRRLNDNLEKLKR